MEWSRWAGIIFLSLGSVWAASACLALVVAAYWATARRLRYRQMDAIERKYSARKHELTLDEAQYIQKWMMEQEFSTMFNRGLFFALFKTYAIPSVSQLLVSTGHLVANEDFSTTSKRVTDTAVLIYHFCTGAPDADRTWQALARMNFLHARHMRAGRITNDAFLYTLALFALEPTRWINRWDWRAVTDTERCAIGTFWMAVGQRMGISYERLPSHEKGWESPLLWLAELEEFAKGHEARNVAPADTNTTLALSTTELLLFQYPSFVKPFIRKIVYVGMGDELREAMQLPKPPAIYETFVKVWMSTRAFLIRNFGLPTSYANRDLLVGEKPDPATGRYHEPDWAVYPWYIKPTFWGRWGPDAWWTWLTRKNPPRVGDAKYRPEGYLFNEVGPDDQFGKGDAEMYGMVREMGRKDSGVSPFVAFKA